MLFNSLIFFLFLPIVFALYWVIAYPKKGQPIAHWRLWLQNFFIVVASYVFYGWWDWRFLFLMTFTSLWAFGSGVLLQRLPEKGSAAKWVVAFALIVNFAILAIFKYYNFFLEQTILFLQSLGFQAHASSLKILLPVGISFYTFQALSYVIDVYRKTFTPTRNVTAFLAYVSFFPLLVAGPIERATNLLPQFQRPRTFDYPLAVEGCRQMLWGFFKKLLVADNCATAANALLGASEPSTAALWVGMICFTFQIYGDFSGYSDIAIGCGKLFGIRAMRNFNYPYFARDIAEFWRRWHISLTTWFRDYLYFPLGGSRCSNWKKVRNTFAIFLVSGLWHGANWTFIVWGAFHAFYFLPLLLSGKNRAYTTSVVAEGKWLPNGRECIQMLSTFFVALLGWVFFRAPTIETAFDWLKHLLIPTTGAGTVIDYGDYCTAYLAIVAMILIEWFNRTRSIPRLPSNRFLRWAIYYLVLWVILTWRAGAETFIYFQF